ncbi:MAG: ligase-associated DNA damage response endonuclease PdeM [Chryseolinea sp.]
METTIAGEQLHLFPQKAIFWPSRRILFVADLHLGKVNHFRRAGIPVPTRANDRNLELIMDLVNTTRPDRFVCLGDLFHSHYNPEWETFGELIKHFRSTSFELVMGNHDIMSDQQYRRKGIVVHDQLCIAPFLLTHHPPEPENLESQIQKFQMQYSLAGHLHPGVTMRGAGRQSVTLPCFYFGRNAGLLPAFGAFTGLARIKPVKEDKVYVIADEKVIRIGN